MVQTSPPTEISSSPKSAPPRHPSPKSAFPDLGNRDLKIFVITENICPQQLQCTDSCQYGWKSGKVRISFFHSPEPGIRVFLESSDRVKTIVLQWSDEFPADTLFLGDAWERSYGDLAWNPSPFWRTMPWYFLATNRKETAGYGVETGGNSLACWRLSPENITLTLDVRSGGAGVVLGQRELHAATIRQHFSEPDTSPFAAAQLFCRKLVPRKQSSPLTPIVGHNDWYWLYGKNSEDLILKCTARLMELCPPGIETRPFSVIDDGWQPLASHTGLFFNGGPWHHGNERFPDMPGLAEKIRSLGARPGIWIRPLRTGEDIPATWQLRRPISDPHGGKILDPSIPEALAKVAADISRLREWGFELIKHDFSTFDISGRWGFEMQSPLAGFTADGWHFGNQGLTTAEVLLGLYRTIRDTAGEAALIMGCNVVGHLAAGLVDIQRTGDDTSATDWDRTRRMGVNTLAFRAPQHGSFFAIDADCVPVSPSIPPALTAQWLDLVARSGTPLFLSIDPAACGPDEKRLLREAIAKASTEAPTAEPLDWIDSPLPSKWMLTGDLKKSPTQFQWTEFFQNMPSSL